MLHAPLALIAALFLVAVAVAGPEVAFSMHPVDLDRTAEGYVTLASLSR